MPRSREADYSTLAVHKPCSENDNDHKSVVKKVKKKPLNDEDSSDKHDRIWFIKEDEEPTQDNISEIKEVITGELIRFLIPTHPKYRLVQSRENLQQLVVASQGVEGFKNLRHEDSKKKFESSQYIPGLAKVALMCILFMAIDPKPDNLGFDNHDNLINIDHDLKFPTFGIYGLEELLQITQDDIEKAPLIDGDNHFPDMWFDKIIKHKNPEFWQERGVSEEKATSILGEAILEDNKFKQEKYLFLLKLLITPEKYFDNVIDRCINNDVFSDHKEKINTLKVKIKQLVSKRLKIMLREALKIEEFRDFLINEDHEEHIAAIWQEVDGFHKTRTTKKARNLPTGHNESDFKEHARREVAQLKRVIKFYYQDKGTLDHELAHAALRYDVFPKGNEQGKIHKNLKHTSGENLSTSEKKALLLEIKDTQLANKALLADVKQLLQNVVKNVGDLEKEKELVEFIIKYDMLPKGINKEAFKQCVKKHYFQKPEDIKQYLELLKVAYTNQTEKTVVREVIQELLKEKEVTDSCRGLQDITMFIHFAFKFDVYSRSYKSIFYNFEKLLPPFFKLHWHDCFVQLTKNYHIENKELLNELRKFIDGVQRGYAYRLKSLNGDIDSKDLVVLDEDRESLLTAVNQSSEQHELKRKRNLRKTEYFGKLSTLVNGSIFAKLEKKGDKTKKIIDLKRQKYVLKAKRDENNIQIKKIEGFKNEFKEDLENLLTTINGYIKQLIASKVSDSYIVKFDEYINVKTELHLLADCYEVTDPNTKPVEKLKQYVQLAKKIKGIFDDSDKYPSPSMGQVFMHTMTSWVRFLGIRPPYADAVAGYKITMKCRRGLNTTLQALQRKNYQTQIKELQKTTPEPIKHYKQAKQQVETKLGEVVEELKMLEQQIQSTSSSGTPTPSSSSSSTAQQSASVQPKYRLHR